MRDVEATMLLGLALGCGHADVRWLVEVARAPWDTSLAITTVDENFSATDATPPDLEDEETTHASIVSPGLELLTFEATAGGEGLATFQGLLLQGTVDGSDWTFTRTFAEEDETTTDKGKYHLVVSVSNEDQLDLQFSTAGGALVGTLDWTQRQAHSWKEADRWSEEQSGYTTAMPAAAYLDDDEVWNAGEEDDCNGDDCLIVATTTAAIPFTLTGIRQVSSDDLATYGSGSPLGDPFQ